MFRRREQHISKALIRQHLEDSDTESTADFSEDQTSDTLKPDPVGFLPTCSSEGNLLDCRLWLQQRCELEQVRLEHLLAEDGHCDVVLEHEDMTKGKGRRCDLRNDQPALDVTVLQRIHEGRGPQDQVPEDLLAAVRDVPLQSSSECYDQSRRTLLAWNKHVSGSWEEDDHAKELLRTAIERRAHLLRAPARGSDKSQFLEESSAELLQALTALRPEIVDFKTKGFLDILVMMWSNVRIAIPDLDDDLRLLTMKALINELESKSHVSNAVKLSGIARSLSVARLQLDSAKIERLEKKMRGFKNKLRETVVKKVIDKIKAGRRELTQVKLRELQELTELQAAQKWASYDKLGNDQYRGSHERICIQADAKLRRVLQHQVPELDAHVNAVQSNANALAGMSAGLLSRAKEAGFSLENHAASVSTDLVNVDVKAYVTGGIADILNAREQAAKMLSQMEAVESHLEVMLYAAKRQYRAHDEALRMAEQAENMYDKEVQLAEEFGFGPRRESILLMCRNMQRAKRAS